jgi:threonine dehydratase
MKVTFQDIQDAAGRIADGIYLSPCPESQPLSHVAGCSVYCKLENLQRTGSFKERGARNAMMLLDDETRRRGVIAASAGNHSQGLSYHGQLLGVPVTVVMPIHAPISKVANCRHLGAEVVLHGEDFAQAREHVDVLAEERGLTHVHGFDDPGVIAGQGTIGIEIINQVPDLDAVVVPIGGAGLIAGIALAVKTLKPDVKVYGVEPTHAASFTAALSAGHPVSVDTRATLADGLAVNRVGDIAFEIARQYVDKVVTVDERWLALAVLRCIELEKSVVEGAGAAGLAALLAGEHPGGLPELAGKRVVLPLCGGNIDSTVLGRVIEHGLAADGRLCRFVTRVSDRPGGLSRFTAVLAGAGVSVKNVSHDRIFAGDDMSSVNVHCLVETRDAEHIQTLKDRLTDAGYQISFPHGDD